MSQSSKFMWGREWIICIYPAFTILQSKFHDHFKCFPTLYAVLFDVQTFTFPTQTLSGIYFIRLSYTFLSYKVGSCFSGCEQNKSFVFRKSGKELLFISTPLVNTHVDIYERVTDYNYARLSSVAWWHILPDGIVWQSARRQLCFVYEHSVSFSQA